MNVASPYTISENVYRTDNGIKVISSSDSHRLIFEVKISVPRRQMCTEMSSRSYAEMN